MSPDMPKKSLKDHYIVQAWLVLILALAFGASLAGVHLTLSATIENNKINETREKIPELVLGEALALKMASQNQSLIVEPDNVEIEKKGKKSFYGVYRAIQNDKLMGWVAKTNGQGYADKIELLIGFDPSAEIITGLFVLEQKETPGLGNKIITPEWRRQFIKKLTSIDLVAAKRGAKAPNEIDAITGATISSRAVCTIINRAMNDLKKPLAKKASKDE